MIKSRICMPMVGIETSHAGVSAAVEGRRTVALVVNAGSPADEVLRHRSPFELAGSAVVSKRRRQTPRATIHMVALAA